MLFHIDPANGLPIYEQVVRQVKFAVAEGVLTRGQLVPSVRELAQTLLINPNTIAAGLRQVAARSGTRPGRGTGLEVATGAAERRSATTRETDPRPAAPGPGRGPAKPTGSG